METLNAHPHTKLKALNLTKAHLLDYSTHRSSLIGYQPRHSIFQVGSHMDETYQIGQFNGGESEFEELPNQQLPHL